MPFNIVNIAYCENIDNNSKPYHNHFPMHNEQNPAYIMPGPAIKLNVYFVYTLIENPATLDFIALRGFKIWLIGCNRS